MWLPSEPTRLAGLVHLIGLDLIVLDLIGLDVMDLVLTLVANTNATRRCHGSRLFAVSSHVRSRS